MNSGQAVIELLKAEQVRYIFGIVGATFLDVLDVLYDDKSVEYVSVRHEQGAAFMADGLARVTMFKPVTKLSILVNEPERIPEILHHAFRTAMTGRKGPVLVDIPRDV